jgi:hypothetical protein
VVCGTEALDTQGPFATGLSLEKKENDDVENDDNSEQDSPKTTPSAEPITLY